MNIIKDYVTISLWLIEIDVMEFLILLTIDRICVPNKTEDINLNVCNLITKINKSNTLTNHILCECKCKFDGKIYNLNQKWNNNNY